MSQSSTTTVSRRRFLKVAGATALATGTGPAIIIPGRTQPKTLKILRARALKPAVIEWQDEFARTWGEQNNIQVVVDWVSFSTLRRLVESEFAAGQGHDLIVTWTSPVVYAQQVIDHREIFQECERRFGKASELAFRSSYSPKADTFFQVMDFCFPTPVLYRKDLWDAVNRAPTNWDEIRLGGRYIKLLHGPYVGINLGPASHPDSDASVRALLYSFGGSVQDADDRPALKSAAALEALKFAKALFEEAMSEEILTWDVVSNNRAMLAEELSLTHNTISIARTGEEKALAVTDKLLLAKTPAGPMGRFSASTGNGGWTIPRFSQNIEAAQRFIVDAVGQSREVFLASEFFFYPVFPQAVSDRVPLLANDASATPPDKYQFLKDALEWTRNFGFPGYSNPAIGEVLNAGLLPAMFASTVTGKMTPEEALTQADQEVRKIFDKWRALGKV